MLMFHRRNAMQKRLNNIKRLDENKLYLIDFGFVENFDDITFKGEEISPLKEPRWDATPKFMDYNFYIKMHYWIKNKKEIFNKWYKKNKYTVDLYSLSLVFYMFIIIYYFLGIY